MRNARSTFVAVAALLAVAVGSSAVALGQNPSGSQKTPQPVASNGNTEFERNRKGRVATPALRQKLNGELARKAPMFAGAGKLRDAFSGRDLARSRTLLREALPAFTERRDPLEGLHVERYVGATGAVVRRTEASEPTFVLGQEPVAARVSGGHRRVDTRLESSQRGLKPRQGASDYVLGERVADGLTFEDLDVSFEPVVSSNADMTPLTVEEDGAWNNGPAALSSEVLTDTDLSWRAGAIGARSMHVLRSQDAPEALEFRVRKPDGWSVVDSGTRPAGVVIEDAQGGVRATVTPPVAADAEGRRVPAELELTAGDVLRISVPHRRALDDGERVSYPVFVDPEFSQSFQWGSNGATTFAPWQYGEWEPGYDGPGAGQWQGWFGTYPGSNANGLWTFLMTPDNTGLNSALLRPGTYVAANTRAPVTGSTAAQRAEGAYIFKGDMGFANWSLGNDQGYKWTNPPRNGHVRTEVGLWSPEYGFAENHWRPGNPAVPTQTTANLPYTTSTDAFNSYVVTCHIVNCGNDGGRSDARPENIPSSVAPPGNYFSLGLNLYEGDLRQAGYNAALYTSGALVQMSDRGGPHPTLSVTGASAWRSTPTTVAASASDYGLGVQAMALHRQRDGGSLDPAVKTATDPCAGISRNGDGTANPPCAPTLPANWTLTPADLGDGAHELQLLAYDVLLKTSNATGVVNFDTKAPTASWVNAGDSPTRIKDGDPLELTAAVTDEHAGLKTTSFEVDGAAVPNSTQTHPSCTASLAEQCPQSAQNRTVSLPAGSLTNGTHTVTVVATDALTQVSRTDRTVVVEDRTAPTIELTGDVTAVPLLVSSDKTLTVEAKDGSTGVHRVEARLDGALLTNGDITRPCTTSCTPRDFTQSFNVPQSALGTGTHRFDVRVTDAAGNAREVTRTVVAVTQPQVDQLFATRKIGFEDWWTFDSTPTGAGGQLRTNLATGNLSWSKTVLENPGRGLGTFLRLTYNSHEPETLAGISAYNQAGRGVSAQLAGITRLNEPLLIDPVDIPNNKPGKLLYVDGDGTRHSFPQSGPAAIGQRQWTAPPGVHLRFRETGTANALSTRAIVATRPDGTTYEFDGLGFLRKAIDRDGNSLTFKYEELKLPALGSPQDAVTGTCGAGLIAKCLFKVVEVIDAPANDDPTKTDARRWTIGYDPKGRISEVRDRRCLTASVSCTDRDQRRLTRFDYTPGSDGALAPDNLTLITEAAGTDDARETRLAYDSGNSAYLTGIGQPKKPTDPAGPSTAVTYVDLPPTLAQSLVPVLGVDRRVATIADRRGSASYTTGGGATVTRPTTTTYGLTRANQQDGPATATVTDPRGNASTFATDGRDRLTRMTDAVGTQFDQQWSDTVNAVTKRTDASNRGAEAAETTFAWGDLGQLQSTTDPIGRSTTFEYRTGKGTVVDGFGDSSAGDWVYDTTKVKRPNAASEETYELDTRGNVIKQTQADGPTTWFEVDARGQVLREVREVAADADDVQPNAGDACSETPPAPYASETTKRRVAVCLGGYDDNGQPTVQTDERGQAWRIAYDSVGNRVAASDPRRGGTAVPASGQAYTASWTYDLLDRPLTSKTPKRSAAGQYIDRSWTYDARDNEVTYTDGTGATFTKVYSATDQVTSSSSPATSHAGESSAQAETEKYEFDAADNLVWTRTPMQAVTQGNSWSTETTYDALNRPVLERQHNTVVDAAKGRPAVLVRSRAYDSRSNLISETDPKGTALAAGQSVSEQQSAGDSRFQRNAWRYDKADQQIRQIENPGDLNLVTARAFDGNGNLAVEVSPRGKVSATPAANERSTLEANAFATVNGYDARDQLISTNAPGYRKSDGTGHERRVTKYQRRTDGQVRAIESPRGVDSTTAGDFTSKFAYQPTGELRSRSEPRAQGQYGAASMFTYYGVNAVGDPTSVTDPRGNNFTNTFLDTGELYSTTRASWWIYDKAEGEIRERTPEDPKPSTDRAKLPTGEAQGDFGSVKQQDMPDPVPAAGSITSADYDNELRLGSVRASWQTKVGGAIRTRKSTWSYDAVGRKTRALTPLQTDSSGNPTTTGGKLDAIVETWSYDRNGQMRAFVDGEGNRSATLTAEGPETERAPYRTSIELDQFGRRITVDSPGSATDPSSSAASGYGVNRSVTRFEHDLNGNETKTVTPTGGAEVSTFDRADRETGTTDPVGNTWGQTPDEDGNVTQRTDPKNRVETTVYDPAGEAVRRTDADSKVSTLEYDRNGNRTLERTPGASQTPGGTVADRVTRTTYDGRDLPWISVEGDGSRDATDPGNRPRPTISEYDGNRNLVRTVKPEGITYENGAYKPKVAFSSFESTVTPTDTTHQNAEVRRYGVDGLLTQRILPSDDSRGDALQDGGASCPSNTKAEIQAQNTSRLDLDGDGNCDTRHRWHQRFRHGPDGEILAISAVSLWRATSDTPTVQSRYSRNGAGWVTTSATVENPGTSETVRDSELYYEYDKQGNQIKWCSNTGNRTAGICDGSSTRATRRVLRTFYPSGKLMQRCAQRRNDAGTVEESRAYRYGYDARGDMVHMEDLNPPGSADAGARCGSPVAGQPISDTATTTPRTTEVTRDLAARETLVDEKWTGGKDTRTRYDKHLLSDRWTDGEYASSTYSGGKHSTFAYDVEDRNTSVAVRNSAASEASPASRTTTIDYWPSGERRETKKPNGRIESRFLDDKGQIVARHRWRTGDATSDSNPRTYSYDLSGNRTRDEKGSHEYNARDQLVKWTRTEDTTSPGKPTITTRYAPFGSGNHRLVTTAQTSVENQGSLRVTQQLNTTSLSQAPKERIDRTRTVGSAEASATGQATVTDQVDETTEYTYDVFGAQTQEKTTRNTGATTGTNRTIASTYDAFQRLLARTPEEATDQNRGKGPAYCYDGLDRRDRRIDRVDFSASSDRFATHKTACTDTSAGPARDYSYVGMSEQLARSAEAGSGTSASAKTYDYTSDGVRLGVKTGDETSATGFRSFDLDAQDSVVGLDNDSSTAGATAVADEDEYRYDPFGKALNTKDADPQSAAVDAGSLSPQAEQNPFRFQGHYNDADNGLYDMKARSYDPAQGRFLSQDSFQDPEADLALAGDPITNDRYAFTAGNPVTRSEYDGHVLPGPGEQPGQSGHTKGAGLSKNEQRQARKREAAQQAEPLPGPGDQVDAPTAEAKPAKAPTRSSNPAGKGGAYRNPQSARDQEQTLQGGEQALRDAVPSSVAEVRDTVKATTDLTHIAGQARTAKRLVSTAMRLNEIDGDYAAGYAATAATAAVVTRKAPGAPDEPPEIGPKPRTPSQIRRDEGFKGSNGQRFGPLWGSTRQGALNRRNAYSASQLRGMGLTKPLAQELAVFYRLADGKGKGATTAGARADLMTSYARVLESDER